MPFQIATFSVPYYAFSHCLFKKNLHVHSLRQCAALFVSALHRSLVKLGASSLEKPEWLLIFIPRKLLAGSFYQLRTHICVTYMIGETTDKMGTGLF